MGVLMPSSNLMKSAKPGNGLRADADSADSSDGKVAENEEGKVAVIGVFSWGSFGLVLVAILSFSTK